MEPSKLQPAAREEEKSELDSLVDQFLELGMLDSEEERREYQQYMEDLMKSEYQSEDLDLQAALEMDLIPPQFSEQEAPLQIKKEQIDLGEESKKEEEIKEEQKEDIEFIDTNKSQKSVALEMNVAFLSDIPQSLHKQCVKYCAKMNFAVVKEDILSIFAQSEKAKIPMLQIQQAFTINNKERLMPFDIISALSEFVISQKETQIMQLYKKSGQTFVRQIMSKRSKLGTQTDCEKYLLRIEFTETMKRCLLYLIYKYDDSFSLKKIEITMMSFLFATRVCAIVECMEKIKNDEEVVQWVRYLRDKHQ